MHVLFVHQNFPAQFGHIAAYLVQRKGFRSTFVSQQPPGNEGGVKRIQYQLRGGATQQTHYCSRSFENAIWHSHAVFEALQARPDIKPDLVVGHSGFLSTTFLRELYDCPIVNYFEYYYHTRGTDMDYRLDFPYPALNHLRARARNASLLMDLEECDAGYSPTHWQRGLMPRTYQHKLRTIFDGVDINLWRPQTGVPRQFGDRVIPDDVRIVTYVSRGMESIRGFDIFMKAAKLLCQRRRDVLFVVVGEDRVCYGGDLEFTGGKSFKEWVLAGDDCDLSRFIFTGLLPTPALAQLFSLSDLHIYLTVPFVLSWSLMDALACGATVLASNTAPVREMIEHDRNGLLVDFFDVEGLADAAERVLDAPGDYSRLGQAGTEMIRQQYSLDVCLPRMLDLYEDACHAPRGG
ncbi:MAG TPA: glycosyltransferase [Pirellulales bacterium]|nr:glycosyltransferase [Pirellulales bacterium]